MLSFLATGTGELNFSTSPRLQHGFKGSTVPGMRGTTQRFAAWLGARPFPLPLDIDYQENRSRHAIGATLLARSRG
ncbi:hypothetical protein OAL29_00580 [Candidatus Binatia bacterium]|nr:hypothetical protein [Candidatus Binatia bacterium]HAC80696.1 hypothetical protein [Deltaproteobacteria bacterium]